VVVVSDVMKGIELPINILIIVAVAVIVLIAVIAMFYPAFTSGGGTVSLEQAKQQACRSLSEGYKCSTTIGLNTILVDNYDVSGNGVPNENVDNLLTMCTRIYRISGANINSDCRKLCGCPT